MAWMRLDPAGILPLLRLERGPGSPDEDGQAEEIMAHVSHCLLNGTYVALQGPAGDVFIGTPEEAASHITGADGVRAGEKPRARPGRLPPGTPRSRHSRSTRTAPPA